MPPSLSLSQRPPAPRGFRRRARRVIGGRLHPATGTAYVAGGVDAGCVVSVISGQTDTVTGTVALGGPATGFNAGGIAVDAHTNRIYVTGHTSTGGQVVVISGRTDAVTATIAVGNSPAAIAIPSPGRSGSTGLLPRWRSIRGATPLYLVNRDDSGVEVIKGSTGTEQRPIIVGIPAGIAVNGQAGMIYISNVISTGGVVSAVDARTRSVAATVPVGNNPSGVAADPRAGTVYVANYMDGTVSVLAA